jgi:predicted secreted hydrolase
MFELLIRAMLNRAIVKSLAVGMLVSTIACTPVATDSESPKESTDLRLFSGLSKQSVKQIQVQPAYPINFPADHVSHPEYAVEWWYVTANLRDQQGRHYALQWTLFRFRADGDPTPWANEQQFMAHAGLHSADNSWFEERFARGGVGNAGVSQVPFQAYLDNWRWSSTSAELFPSSLQFTIEQDVRVNLNLSTNGDFVLHGMQGYSRKLRGSTQASYYYSQPHIAVEGTVAIANKDINVSGQAWFDHEWTSQYLDPNTQGWDWFSIHLHNGDKLMLFNMRHQREADFWSGSLIKSDGKKFHLDEQDIQAHVIKRYEIAGRSLPLEWSIQLPEHKIDITVLPFKKNQWNSGIFSYYEGGTIISGSHTGRGFIELTGY